MGNILCGIGISDLIEIYLWKAELIGSGGPKVASKEREFWLGAATIISGVLVRVCFEA